MKGALPKQSAFVVCLVFFVTLNRFFVQKTFNILFEFFQNRRGNVESTNYAILCRGNKFTVFIFCEELYSNQCLPVGVLIELIHIILFDVFVVQLHFVAILITGVEVVAEVVVIEDKKYLGTQSLYGCHLDDKWMVSVVNDDVHSSEADYLV